MDCERLHVWSVQSVSLDLSSGAASQQSGAEAAIFRPCTLVLSVSDALRQSWPDTIAFLGVASICLLRNLKCFFGEPNCFLV